MQMDLLETPGGAIAILLLLSLLGVAMTGLKIGRASCRERV